MPDKPTNVVGRRVGAWFIDAILWWLIAALLWILFTDRLDADTTTGGGFVIGETRYGFSEDSGGKRGAWLLLSFATWVALFVVVPGLRGTSPGRALTKIRLVNPEGKPPGVGRSILRQLIWIADGFPYFIPNLTGFILTLTTQGNRRLGDMAADTYTVRAEAAGQPVGPALGQPGPGFGYSHVPPPQYAGPSQQGWGGAQPPPGAPPPPGGTPPPGGPPQWQPPPGQGPPQGGPPPPPPPPPPSGG